LGRFLRAARKTAITPLTILKQAVLLHFHLQLAPTIHPQTAIDFVNLLLARCDAIVELYGEGDCEMSCGNSKSTGSRSEATTREDETFQGKEVFLVSKMVRPYLRYLQRLVSIFDDYHSLPEREGSDSALVWQLVNMLRGVTGITGHFVMIGRYFMREYGGAVLLLASGLTRDISLYMDCLRRYVSSRNYALSCSTADSNEVQEFVSVLNELTVLN
jgi:hypothetical protein